MKLLLNDKEIAHFLISLIDHKEECLKITHNEKYLMEALEWALEKKGQEQWVPKKYVEKAKDKIRSGIERDLKNYVRNVETVLENRRNMYYDIISKNIEYFIAKLGTDKIFELYKKSKSKNFVKSLGFYLDDNASLIRRKNYTSFEKDCLFRNMDGNENLLLQKIQNNWPFWFIDTGYTNFLHGKNKKWHRLVRNQMHHSDMFEAPVDRLNIFECFPKQWRSSGEKILIIEPGMFCARTFGIDIEKWKKETVSELRKYTDKKIVIREKLSKKVRKNLYHELCDDDYYCVVNINSNAATEAIWAGIPTITLQRHITNSVSKNNLKDIDNLYRGSLAQWLAYLSYSQFTYEEIINGIAAEIIKKYHVQI